MEGKAQDFSTYYVQDPRNQTSSEYPCLALQFPEIHPPLSSLTRQDKYSLLQKVVDEISSLVLPTPASLQKKQEDKMLIEDSEKKKAPRDDILFEILLSDIRYCWPSDEKHDVLLCLFVDLGDNFSSRNFQVDWQWQGETYRVDCIWTTSAAQDETDEMKEENWKKVACHQFSKWRVDKNKTLIAIIEIETRRVNIDDIEVEDLGRKSSKVQNTFKSLKDFLKTHNYVEEENKLASLQNSYQLLSDLYNESSVTCAKLRDENAQLKARIPE